ncbi:MAG: transposase [Dermatophilaceae bacterium]
MLTCAVRPRHRHVSRVPESLRFWYTKPSLIISERATRAPPAAELAELYHARWQIENAFGAFKSGLKGDRVVLDSKTPDGAEQELWALLCVDDIRELICAAAELTDQDPLRLSLFAALDATAGPVGDPAAFPP